MKIEFLIKKAPRVNKFEKQLLKFFNFWTVVCLCCVTTNTRWLMSATDQSQAEIHNNQLSYKIIFFASFYFTKLWLVKIILPFLHWNCFSFTNTTRRTLLITPLLCMYNFTISLYFYPEEIFTKPNYLPLTLL